MTNLKIPPEEAIRLLNERIASIPALCRQQQTPGFYDVVKWCSKTWSVIDAIYGADDMHAEEIRLIALPPCSCDAPARTLLQLEIYEEKLENYIDEIRAGMQDGKC